MHLSKSDSGCDSLLEMVNFSLKKSYFLGVSTYIWYVHLCKFSVEKSFISGYNTPFCPEFDFFV